MSVKKGSILLKKTSVRYKVGDKFGLLEIIGERTITNKRAKYLCRCECGKESFIGEQELRCGQKSCKACVSLAKEGHRSLLGKQLGCWVVKEFIGLFDRNKECPIRGKRIDRVYKCACYKCGFNREFRGNNLSTFTMPQCPKCKEDNWLQDKAWGRILGLVILSAKKRELIVSINEKYIETLYNKQNGRCALSGLPISIPQSNKEMMEYTWTASLDRIDSNIGYVDGNVQFVHKAINQMKMDSTEKDFIFFCKLVAHHNTYTSPEGGIGTTLLESL